MVGLHPAPARPSVVPPRIVAREPGARASSSRAFLAAHGHRREERLREGGFVTGRPGHETRPDQRRPAGPPGAAAAARCCPRTRSCRRTACGRCRGAIATHPFRLELGGADAPSVDYEPGESTSGLFGGNSNWRGPGLVPAQLPGHRVARATGTLVHGRRLHGRVPDRLGHARPAARRGARTSRAGWSPSGCPTPTAAARCYGSIEKFQTTPSGATCCCSTSTSTATPGPGIGASHQTGWTGLVAHLLCRGGVLDTIRAGSRCRRA